MLHDGVEQGPVLDAAFTVRRRREASSSRSHADRIKRLGLSGIGADSGVDYPAGNDLSLVCIGFTELHTDIKSGVKPSWRMWEFQPYAWHPDAVLVCCQTELGDFAPDLDELAEALMVEDGGRDHSKPSRELLGLIAKWVWPVAIYPTREPVKFRADLPHALVPSSMADSVIASFMDRPTTSVIKAVEEANEGLKMPALVWRWRMLDDNSKWFEEGDDCRPRFEPVGQVGAPVTAWPEPSTVPAEVDFRIADTAQLLGRAACQSIERCLYADRVRPGDRQWFETVMDVAQCGGVEHINRFFRETVLPDGSKLVLDEKGCLTAIEVVGRGVVPIQFPLSSSALRAVLLEAGLVEG